MIENNKNKYDVIIAGASFAGLATASNIKNGRVLLIDRKPIGTNIKSACGTTLKTITKLDLENSVLQVHNKIIIHFAFSNLTFDLTEPFCIIDGKVFFQDLFKKSRADFVQATITNYNKKKIKTTRNNYNADIFVDASGPESVLTKKKNMNLSFGLETTVKHKEEGLHFWYEPKIFPKGVFWVFPQGKTSRVGIGSYIGKTNLMPYLNEFLKRFNFEKIGDIHGGYFPYRFEDPIFEDVFLVGDSAGQCLPLTGEGIRPAIFFGQKLGEIIDFELEKKISHAESKSLYRNFVFEKNRKMNYEKLYWTQKIFTNTPEFLTYLCIRMMKGKFVKNIIMNKYLNFS